MYANKSMLIDHEVHVDKLLIIIISLFTHCNKNNGTIKKTLLDNIYTVLCQIEHVCLCMVGSFFILNEICFLPFLDRNNNKNNNENDNYNNNENDNNNNNNNMPALLALFLG